MRKQIKILATIMTSMLLLVGLVTACLIVPDPNIDTRGVSNLSSLHLSDSGGTATPVLMVDQTGSGRLVEFRDGGTPVWSIDDGGAVTQAGGATYSGVLDMNGQKIDLDADADTSITADTDDQIDVEIGGADEFVFTADQLDMTNGQVVNIGAAGTDFTSSGGLTLAAGLTVSDGNAQVNDFIIADAAAAIDASSDAVITPTGTYQQLTASGATTPTVTTSGITTGTLLVLINTAAQDILIQDSGTMMLNTDRTLNQYDTLMLWFDGTNWLELSTTNN